MIRSDGVVTVPAGVAAGTTALLTVPASELPPRIPRTLAEVDRATALLGAYIQARGNIKPSRLSDLDRLIGVVPGLDQAGKWKSALKKVRGELFDRAASA